MSSNLRPEHVPLVHCLVKSDLGRDCLCVTQAAELGLDWSVGICWCLNPEIGFQFSLDILSPSQGHASVCEM